MKLVLNIVLSLLVCATAYGNAYTEQDVDIIETLVSVAQRYECATTHMQHLHDLISINHVPSQDLFEKAYDEIITSLKFLKNKIRRQAFAIYVSSAEKIYDALMSLCTTQELSKILSAPLHTRILVADGSENAPAFSFVGDTLAGLYIPRQKVEMVKATFQHHHTQLIPQNTPLLVTFDIGLDSDAYAHPSSTTYTVPTSGIYAITATLHIKNNEIPDEYICSILHNAQSSPDNSLCIKKDASQNSLVCCIDRILQLHAGDTIEIQISSAQAQATIEAGSELEISCISLL